MEYTTTKMSNKTNVAESSHDEAAPTATDIISTLPNEIKVMICDRLTAKDVARTSRCSRRFDHLGKVHQQYLTRCSINRNVAKIHAEMGEFREIKRQGDFLECLLRFMRFQGLAVGDARTNWAVDCKAFVSYWLHDLETPTAHEAAILEMGAHSLLLTYIKSYFPEYDDCPAHRVIFLDIPGQVLEPGYYDDETEMRAQLVHGLTHFPLPEDLGFTIDQFEQWEDAILKKRALCLDYSALVTSSRTVLGYTDNFYGDCTILQESGQKGPGPAGIQLRATTPGYCPYSDNDEGLEDSYVRLEEQMNLSQGLHFVHDDLAWEFGEFMPYHVYGRVAAKQAWKFLVEQPQSMTPLQRAELLEDMSIKPRSEHEPYRLAEDVMEREEICG